MVRWPAAARRPLPTRENIRVSPSAYTSTWASGSSERGSGCPRTRWPPRRRDGGDGGSGEPALAAFRQLAGGDPTHLDSHQHVHLREPLRSVLIELAAELAVPLRHNDPRIRYNGDFYGQTGEGRLLPEAISVEALIDIFAALPSGATELACHNGGLDDELQDVS